jgi:epoxyqueuosine reductase
MPSLAEILEMDEEAFRERFRGSPIKRARWRGLVRNALIVAGNRTDPALLPLVERYCQHPDPMLREHAEWAKRRILQACSAPTPRHSIQDTPSVAEE